MHIQPIDNSCDLEPFVIAGMSPQPQQSAVPGEAGETFDDVWGSGPSSPTLPARDDGSSRAAHPSDIPRLQAEHSTAGYREGVTDAKNQSIQAGFDEGFGLGAAIGSKAGQLLGVLEGISDALTGSEDHALRDAAAKTLRDAREELRIERMFSPEYWNADGTWKYDVGAGEGEAAGVEEGDILFAHVADAHPLIAKWAAVVEGQIGTWAIDRDVFADVADEERQHAQDKPASAAAPQVRKPLDW